MIFKDLPFLERLEKVKETGVGAFEFWEWKNKGRLPEMYFLNVQVAKLTNKI